MIVIILVLVLVVVFKQNAIGKTLCLATCCSSPPLICAHAQRMIHSIHSLHSSMRILIIINRRCYHSTKLFFLSCVVGHRAVPAPAGALGAPLASQRQTDDRLRRR
jgi:hypothetical protein